MQTEDHLTEFVNSYEYSENSEEIMDEVSFSDNSPFITQPEALLVKTSVLSLRNSLLNIRESLLNYRSKAACKIQRFFRSIKEKTRARRFFFLLHRTHEKIQKISKEFAINLLKFKLKSLKNHENLQKNYKKIINHSSPKRKMLVRAVSIGRALRKIDNFVEKVASRRGSPESPVKINENYRKEVKKVRKAQSFFIKLIASNTEDSESQDSKSTTPGLDQVGWKTFRTSIDSTMESLNEPLPGSLVFKRNFRVRTQKRIRLNVDELENVLCADLKAPIWKFEGCIGSRIPYARPQRELEDFHGVRDKLTCEYKDLIKS